MTEKWLAGARMADSTKAMRKSIVDRDILPPFENRQLNEITADDLRALCKKVMIQMHAVMSEWERDQISERTTAALAAAKARGVVLGATGPRNLRQSNLDRQAAADAFAARMSGLLRAFVAQGLSQRAMVTELNRAGVKPFRGSAWHLGQVHRCLVRLRELPALAENI